MDNWLVADIGGTNTRVGLTRASGRLPGTTRSLRNADYPGLSPLLTAYLDELNPGPVSALCAGVAGPVQGGSAQLTNHSWFITTDDLRAATGAQTVHLLNDLQAHGYALDDLAPGNITGLIAGTPDTTGPRLVFNLGTGCNIAVVHRLGSGLFVPPSESGHTTLPDWPGMRALFDRLRADHPHLPIECALSGPGLTNLHAALTGTRLPPAALLSGTHPETLTTFIRLLGHVAGNLCLSYMATGGLFLTGGPARALAPHIPGPEFTAAFTARGPYAGIMQDMPVSLITDDSAALTGCTRFLRQYLP